MWHYDAAVCVLCSLYALPSAKQCLRQQELSLHAAGHTLQVSRSTATACSVQSLYKHAVVDNMYWHFACKQSVIADPGAIMARQKPLSGRG